MNDTQCIIVDSRFRNYTYPNPNAYTVFLDTPLYNVSRVDVIDAFIPLSTDRYIFLDIDELRSKFGTHVCMSNSSYQSVIVSYNPDGSYVTRDVKYNNPIISGYFAHFMYPDTTSNLSYVGNSTYAASVKFKQPIESLKQLTVRWVDRFNRPVYFKDSIDHVFTLRVYSERKIDEQAIASANVIESIQKTKPMTNGGDPQTLAALVTSIFVFLMTALA